MSVFAIDERYSQPAKLQNVTCVDAVLEKMYSDIRHFTHIYFKFKKKEKRLYVCR